MSEPRTSIRAAKGPSRGPTGRPSLPTARPASPPDRVPAGRALVVGLDEPSLGLCETALREAGFIVDRVDSGIAAVVAARRVPPELIVMGPQLRDVSSSEAVSWLRSNPALATTSIYVLVSLQEEASLSPHSTPLRKPLSIQAIRRLIRKDHERRKR